MHYTEPRNLKLPIVKFVNILQNHHVFIVSIWLNVFYEIDLQFIEFYRIIKYESSRDNFPLGLRNIGITVMNEDSVWM
jgi:hypothetical protein